MSQSPPIDPRTSRRAALLIAAGAAAISFAVYVPSLSYGFVNWDDPSYVTRNHRLGSFDIQFIGWAFTTFDCANWHPMTWLSLGLDQAIWRGASSGFRLTNALLHALNTFLVTLLALRLFGLATGHEPGARARRTANLVAAGVVGTVFGLHPLHVESVAWVSERKDVLCAAFSLASVLLYLRFTRARTDTVRIGSYLASLALLGMALLSKPMAVSLPVVLLILDAYPLRRFGSDRRRTWTALTEKIPYAVLALGSAVMTLVAQAAGGAMGGMQHVPLISRLWGAEQALVFYLQKIALPIDLVPLYPLPSEINPLTWTCLAPLVLLLAAATVAVVVRRRAPVVATAAAFFGITLLPVLGIVQVGSQAAADRYAYLAMLGPLFLLGAAARGWWQRAGGRRAGRVAMIAVGGLAVVTLATLTVRQARVWRDSTTLWSRVIAYFPRSSTAHYNLGNALRDRDELTEAVSAWKRTVEVDPRHSLALNQLGIAAAMAGDVPEARDYFLSAVDADPGNAEAQFNLALALEKTGSPAAARRHYRLFLEVAGPEFAEQASLVRQRLLEDR